jgi:hypothetical protein
MLDANLKNEWLEKVKIKKNQMVWGKWGNFSVNTELHSAPDEVKEDYDINLTAALTGKEFLWNLHKKFRGDKEFIFTLMNHNYENDIYDSLTNELKNDPELFLLCIKRGDDFRWSLNREVLENRELILEAMKIKDIYPHLKDKYNLDKEIVQLHLQHSPSSFGRMMKSMKNYFSSPKRKNIIIDLMTKSGFENYNIYQELSPQLQEDLEVIDSLLSKSINNFRYLPESIQKDKAFNLYAIDKYGITSVDNELSLDKEIAEKIVSKDGALLKFFPQFQNDLEMINLAFKTCQKIDILSLSMLKDKDLVTKFLKANPENCKTLLNKTEFYNEDFDIMKLCVEYDGNLLKESRTLRNNPELAELALASTQDFSLLSTKHIMNKNLVLQLLKNSKSNCEKAKESEYFLELYWNDKDVAELVVASDTKFILHFPALMADESFVRYAISKGLDSISHIDTSLHSNKDLMIDFCGDNLVKYMNLPLPLKNDHDIALNVLKTQRDYSKIIRNSSLSADKDFILKAINKIPTVYDNINDLSPFKQDPDIIVKYIESCQFHSINTMLPISVCQFYESNDPLVIKSLILQQQLDDSLMIKTETKEKKLKI